MSVRPLAAATLLALMLPASAAWAAPEARAVFHGNDGAAAGAATLHEGPTGVLLRIEVEGWRPAGTAFTSTPWATARTKVHGVRRTYQSCA